MSRPQHSRSLSEARATEPISPHVNVPHHGGFHFEHRLMETIAGLGSGVVVNHSRSHSVSAAMPPPNTPPPLPPRSRRKDSQNEQLSSPHQVKIIYALTIFSIIL